MTAKPNNQNDAEPAANATGDAVELTSEELDIVVAGASITAGTGLGKAEQLKKGTAGPGGKEQGTKSK